MNFDEFEQNVLSTLDQDILAHGLGMYLLNYMTPCPVDFSKLRETAATRALTAIHHILENRDLTDFECVEAIIEVVASVGGHTARHDY